MTGAQLKSLRKDLGISQEKLARRIGVSSNTVWRWEHDQRLISPPIALLLEMIAAQTKKERAA